MHTLPQLLDGVQQLFQSRNPQSIFLARQVMLSKLPASHFIEKYLVDNERRKQSLDNFPMMRQIYDNLPSQLLLKCSRKTLKSTLLSNIICLNTIRWADYKMLYVSPQEAITKYFSSAYVAPRFASPELKKIFIKGWEKNDVYVKLHGDTNSEILFKYANVDATRCRGPATDHNFHDEVQDMIFEILPIIGETMSMSRFKRECFAGTPLTTDNTINELWRRSTQLEWASKCEGCNHWNMLIEENDPIKMIRQEGLSCSACGKLLDTSKGEWVSSLTDPSAVELVGYHLAQPILPHYNTSAKSWKKIYNKVTDGSYGMYQIYNEVFGLAYDVGSKPITREELEALCVLGPIKDEYGNNRIFEENKNTYVSRIFIGVDWGVSTITSRTAYVYGAIRGDGRFEVFDCGVYKTTDHEEHIKDIAAKSNKLNAIAVVDSGPDTVRGYMLGDRTAQDRILMVRYTNGKLVQAYDMPTGAPDWKSNRYLLHRSDCLSFTIRMLKAGKVLFPAKEDVNQCFEDILSEFIETKESNLVAELIYSHPPLKPDDFLHALTFALVAAYTSMGDPMLVGPGGIGKESTTAFDPSLLD